MKPIIDFEILPTFNPKTLIISDASYWEHLEKEHSYIDITLPAKKKAVTHNFQKHKSTKYNSSTLEYSCADCDEDMVELPDGMYHIKVYICEGCKFSKEKYYLRAVKFRKELDERLIKMNLSGCIKCDEDLMEFIRIEKLLDSAYANTRAGLINEAMQCYNMAKELFKECDCGS